MTRTSAADTSSLSRESIAEQLGWVNSSANYCGGYYLEQPFVYPVNPDQKNAVEISSDQTLFSQKSTSVLEGKVTLTREGQQMTANKAYLYRDPETGKLSALEMIGHVNLREPNTLVVAQKGRYNFETKSKSLLDIFYRTTLNGRRPVGPHITPSEENKTRKITGTTAWGTASEISQSQANIYDLYQSNFSTCPPASPAWHVKASHIVLNKDTGRGYATNARIYVKSVPVLYLPYLNFSIDGQRKTGFLWPMIGTSNKWGAYLLAPFYWNLAPNYDTTITPGILTKRGIQLADNTRYLSTIGTGNLQVTVLPNDREFNSFQNTTSQNPTYANSQDTVTQAEYNRLENASDTRKSLIWHDLSHFSPNWSSKVDFNYVGDDYYFNDFGNSLNEVTTNQLLQEGDLFYKNEHWNFTGRVQAYQTLHPVDEDQVYNQYQRLPQLLLSADYPDQPFGLEYFVDNELTHFNIMKNPGTELNMPMGNRMNIQPGISLPLTTPYVYITPRLQLGMTQYQMYQLTDTETPGTKRRVIPIFDMAMGATFERDFGLFGMPYEQTLEPQAYYTYIPYRNQASIPVFDTTVNTLTYDQLFNYNRFSGIDRIGDANQLGLGVSSRFIDQESGLEKARVGVGDIIYFANRLVTLCNDTSCSDNPFNHANYQRLSPISGMASYSVNPLWSVGANAIWNPVSKQTDNNSVNLHYQSDERHIVNLGYSFARNGDIYSGISTNTSENNLKLTDLSMVWPLTMSVSALGRWSEDWHISRLQNLLGGLQYDTCCWAMRLVGGREFTRLNPNSSTPQYNNEVFIQFALKGLGNIGSGNPSGILSNIYGYRTDFGQDS